MRSNYNQEVNHVPLFVNMKRFLKFAIAYNFFWNIELHNIYGNRCQITDFSRSFNSL